MPVDNDTHGAVAPDPVFTERLAAQGLVARVVPVSDGRAFAGWIQAVARGFLDGERSPEEVAAARERLGYRRKTGVFDESGPMPDVPVATFASWVDELTVPGGAVLPACAISSVTVSPTHRRRGLARAMMEHELRLAAGEGVPLAMLTVSESTLYGRYGFGPAAAAANWTIDTTRAGWTGPIPGGRVDFIPREEWRRLGAELHERIRTSSPGEIGMPGGHWDRFAGTRPDVKDAGARRAVRYADEAGEVRGLALYTVSENHDDYARSRARVSLLLAETPDAYAALWRFLLELDLIGEVTASELAVDEALLWMIADQRAATVTVRDHQYVRILDVPAALSARRYAASGRLVLDVSDPLGHAEGRWLLEVDASGRGRVSRAGATPADAVVVELGVTELSTAYLGGVSLETLALAGRVRTTDAATAARLLGWHRAPRLSFWY